MPNGWHAASNDWVAGVIMGITGNSLVTGVQLPPAQRVDNGAGGIASGVNDDNDICIFDAINTQYLPQSSKSNYLALVNRPINQAKGKWFGGDVNLVGAQSGSPRVSMLQIKEVS